jgi:hypothetical protein
MKELPHGKQSFFLGQSAASEHQTVGRPPETGHIFDMYNSSTALAPATSTINALACLA